MVRERTGFWLIAAFFVLLVAACSAPDSDVDANVLEAALSPSSPTASRDDVAPLAPSTPTRTPDDATRGRGENPRRFGSPPGYLFDAIPPVYDPVFAGVDEAPLDDDELVIGVEVDGQAKAYPITVMRSREMVNDELGGIPILVTW